MKSNLKELQKEWDEKSISFCCVLSEAFIEKHKEKWIGKEFVEDKN